MKKEYCNIGITFSSECEKLKSVIIKLENELKVMKAEIEAAISKLKTKEFEMENKLLKSEMNTKDETKIHTEMEIKAINE